MSTPLYKVPRKPAPSRARKSGEVYQLRVDLRGLKPKVWRRIVVPVAIDLSLLHVVLLRAMGWEGGHMHQFIFAQASYTGEEPGLDLPAGVDDESGVSLRKALEGGSSFTWVYDYGDNWQHKVKVERTVDMVVPLEHPMCITGQGACPPEDIGGVPGYEEFLQAMADPVHPEHVEMMEWHGGPFDPAAFSADEVQARFNECRL
jgi:hypothetical protein